MRAPLRSITLARLQFVVVLGVALSFLAVSVLARTRARAVDRNVSLISDDAMPSVRHLSRARGELRRLDDSVARLSRDVPTPTAVADVRRDLRGLDEAFRSYAERALSPGEASVQRAAAAALARVESGTASTLQEVDGGDRAGARAAVSLEREDSAELDELLGRLIDLNASAGAELGETVQRARHETRHVVMVLDICIAALALLAAALAAVSLRRAMRALEERSSELDQFAGRVAHDVLGPLSSSVLALQVARRRHPDDEALQSVAARGLAGIERSRRLVDGLLEFARAGSTHDAASCSLADVAGDVLAEARVDAATSRIRLRVEALDPCVVACGAGVLTSMLSNLLRNAVKHMGERAVREVTVRCVQHGTRCRIEVDDTGPGVPDELTEAIFEPFVRGRSEAPGVGLGLATVRRLARAHGGDAGCARRAAGGSRFWIELPIDRAASSGKLPRLTG